jgi:hypothetical protein
MDTVKDFPELNLGRIGNHHHGTESSVSFGKVSVKRPFGSPLRDTAREIKSP